MAALEGCPLNGAWTLSVRDTQTTANGFLFNWALRLADELDPNAERFQPALTAQSFSFEPQMVFYLPDTFAIPAQNPGEKYYQFEVSDDFGCTYETQVRAQILAETAPECLACTERYEPLPDTLLCRGDSLTLAARGTYIEPFNLTFSSDPKYAFGFSNHPPETPYRSALNVAGVAQDTIRNPFQEIVSICVTIESDFNEDLAIFLRAPDGRLLELSTNNGGGFDNYTNTCFTPTAQNPITQGAAPFRGNYSPEGSFGALVGAPANGEWELVVSDAFDATSFSRLVSWSITFRNFNAIQYRWSPAEGLSCTDCPQPRVSPAQTSNYQLELTDSYGCTFQDEFLVTVLDTFAAPEIICGPLRPGEMIFSWNSLGPGISYTGTLNINGTDSMLAMPIQDTFLIVDGLVFGDRVGLSLSAVPPDDPYPCFVGVGQSECVFDDCFTFTRISRTEDVACFGEATGLVEVSAIRGFRPFTYYLNSDLIGQSDSVFTGLTAGAYRLITEDREGCRDTLSFSITQPEPIVNDLQILDTISCAGDSTASIAANPRGGTGDLSLSWNYPLVDSLTFLENIPTGNYVLRTRDEAGCEQADSVQITEPDSLLITSTLTPISCAGDADGMIVTAFSGGTGAITYSWGDGFPDSIRINVEPGVYFLSVTDENGCVNTREFNLPDPLPLVLDTIVTQTVSCFGRNNGEAEVFVSGGTQPYNYQWLDSLSQTTGRANNLPGGMVEVRVTDDRGCLVNEFVEVPEPDLLEIGFDLKMVSCLGGSDARATAQVSGGTMPYTYLWQNGSSQNSVEQLPQGNYNLTVTDANGCRSENTAMITEPDSELVVGAAQDFSGCYGARENEARAIASGGGDSQYSYAWSDGQDTEVAVGLDSLIYSVTITDANGCAKTSSIKLNDLPRMEPNTIIQPPNCFGFTDGAIGINFIEGRPGADLDAYQFVWNTGQLGPTINNLVGDSLYTVTVTDPQGCRAVTSRLVRQPKLITFQTEITDVSCFGGSDGQVRVTNISAETSQFSFQWDDRAGNQTDALATGLIAGVYTVTVSDEQNCENVAQVEVGEPTEIEVSFETTDNTCFGDLTGAISASATGGTPGYRFGWSNGRTGPELENVAAGNYQLTVSDARNCFSTTSIELGQPDPLDVTVNTQDVSCFGDQDGTIQVLVNGGAPPYRFSTDRVNYSGSPVILGLSAGEYNVAIRDANDCVFLVSAMIEEPPPLVVDAGPDRITIPFGDSVQLKAGAENNQGPVTFEWVEPFPDALPCLLCDSVTVKPAFSVAYELIGLDSAGCQASDFVNIFVEKEQFLAVPTGFTPNNDGRNDRLIVHGDPTVVVNIFQIYDRLGELVYEAEEIPITDPNLGWDGTFKGQEMPQDTYIWYIEATFNGQRKAVFRGQTTLIR